MAMGTTTTTYTTIPLPKTTPNTTLLSALATKFRAFKLHAFKVAPAAFSVVYDAEAQLPLSTWLARITEPSTTILICVATSTQHQHCNDAEKEEDTQSKILLDGEWTGTFTMIGPITRQDYLFPLSGQPTPGPEGSETRWQLTTLFTLPAYRGHGIAKLLTLAALTHGKSISASQGSATKTRIRLVVHPDNTGVVKMYEKFGFVDCARMTVAEACRANLAADAVPRDADVGKWHSRFAVAMEIVV